MTGPDDAFSEVPIDLTPYGYPPAAPYTQPAVSVRATFQGSDGRRPEEIIVEWKTPPPVAEVSEVLEVLASIAAGELVSVRVSGPNRESVQPTRLPVSPDDAEPYYCGAQGPGHDATVPGHHGCGERAGHEPVEPQGREHRCVCGGIFAADDEVPDVPGQRGRQSRSSR